MFVRELFVAPADQRVMDVMVRDVITVTEDTDQEEVSRLLAEHDLLAIPVVDRARRLQGIVTVDDVVDVVTQEATEDIQKLGGMQALEEPYLQARLGRMIRKRGVWLAALFVGEMLTATAMAHFEEEIARAVVLALFMPLIISERGQLRLPGRDPGDPGHGGRRGPRPDWWRVIWREAASGLVLGSVLGVIGLARILTWQMLFGLYGEHAVLLGLTVAVSLLGVVLWGTLAGSMLPFALRVLGVDPASASAPFVATLVDVSGIFIYFTVASVVLRGTLL